MAGICLAFGLALVLVSSRRAVALGEPTWSADRFQVLVRWSGAVLTVVGIAWLVVAWLTGS